MAGLVRLGHPFPSLLDGAVVAATALLAGAQEPRALALGASMTALQVAIGSLNDLVDAPSDAGHKPGKPIPAGLVSPAVARVLALVAAGAGLGGSALLGGLPLTGVAIAVLAIGAVYDLWAKGTPWSWLPFAVGIPILPVYGWLGGAGELAGWTPILLPAGALAGAGLAIANARADLERDRAAGRSSVAVWLGPVPSWWASVLALGLAMLLVVSGTPTGFPMPWSALAVAGGGLVVAGAALGASPSPDARERAWQLLALGVAGIAVGWLGAAGG